MLKRVIRSVYHEMQQHYLSFRFLVGLKECGITRRVNFLMIRIIEHIHELVPEYRLYVRHHSKSNVETLVYAVV